MRQLDGLRAVAVAMVVVSHWYPKYESPWFNGVLGVKLFFVLSGFLITQILLDLRRRSQNPIFSIRAFYARRFLRIFPAFYATLLLYYLVDSPLVRQSIWWHLAYLSNFFFCQQGEWNTEICHFWSLSVEEQFYLLWPWVVLYFPRRLLLPLMLCLVTSNLFMVQIRALTGMSAFSFFLLPLQHLPSLSVGALFAYLHEGASCDGSRTLRLAYCLAIGGGFGCLAYSLGVESLLCTLALGGLVYCCAVGVKGPAKKLLELPYLVHLGKISYGIYLIHPFIAWRMEWFFWRARLGYLPTGPHGSLLVGAANVGVLLLVTQLSWKYFESPVNRLKSRFPYFPAEVRNG